MVHTQIKILDKGQGPAFPDLQDKVVHQVNLDRFVILQGGMKSGKPSVAVLAELPNGEWVFVETSGRIFDGLMAALRGALQRWGEEL